MEIFGIFFKIISHPTLTTLHVHQESFVIHKIVRSKKDCVTLRQRDTMYAANAMSASAHTGCKKQFILKR